MSDEEEDKTLLPTEPSEDGLIDENDAPAGSGHHATHHGPGEGRGAVEPAGGGLEAAHGGGSPGFQPGDVEPGTSSWTAQFYAACDSGHAAWLGPNREVRDDAVGDADQHNSGCAARGAVVVG